MSVFPLFYPAQVIDRETKKLFLAMFEDTDIKAMLSKHIRVEMDNERAKYRGQVQSYDSLTSGNVNMQQRMAASGYDIYGRTILMGNKRADNNNTYKKMKNRIKYGRAPQHGYYNRGAFKIE